jgi:predicted  nucleic acid-binding Zn-ribbon protein
MIINARPRRYRNPKRLTEESHLAAEERVALEKKVEQERQEIEKAKAEQAKFAGRLKELARFLAKGSDKLKEKTQKNEAEIAAIRAKLKKREDRAEQIQRELEEKKAKKQQMMEQCTTIQAKVGMVSDKLKETLGEYSNMKAKIPEVEKTIQQDREQLAVEIDSLNRQLELYSLILENFVPQSEVQRIRTSAIFDEDREKWEVPEADKRTLLKKVLALTRPNSAIGAPRPTATVRTKPGQSNDDGPALELRATHVESRLKDGPKIIDMNGIEEEIEDKFRDDESDLVVEIPQELPGIPTMPSYAASLSIVRSAMR